MALITGGIQCPLATVGYSSQPGSAASTTCASSLIVTLDGASHTTRRAAASSVFRCVRHMHLPLAHLNDVMKAAEVSGTVLVTALTYIYRMKARHHQWEDAHLDTAAATSQTQGRAPTIPTECCHCLFLVCTLLANKFVKDEAYRNVHFAKWCGMPVKELGKLEMAVLECMDYRMSVNPKLFETFAHLLVVPRSAAPASARPAFTGQVHSGAALRGARPEAIVVAVLTAPWRRHLQQYETIPAHVLHGQHHSTQSPSQAWAPMSPANSLDSFTSGPACSRLTSPTPSGLACSLPASPESLCCDASPMYDLACSSSEATYTATAPCVSPSLPDTAGGSAARRSERVMASRPTPYSRHVPHSVV